MKLSLLAACTLAVAVAESAIALPFPSDYQGAAARDLEARELQARAVGYDFEFEYPVARSPARGLGGLLRSKSAPSLKAPATHESIPMGNLGKASSSAPAHDSPPPVPPKDNNKGKGKEQPNPPPIPAKSPNRPQPAAAQTEEQRKKLHDEQTLATSKASLAETKDNNAKTQAHNAKMRKLGMAGVGISALGGATAIGLGINSALETHNKNQFDEQQKQQAAQQQAQPARRAIIDGEVYELYWVN